MVSTPPPLLLHLMTNSAHTHAPIIWTTSLWHLLYKHGYDTPEMYKSNHSLQKRTMPTFCVWVFVLFAKVHKRAFEHILETSDVNKSCGLPLLKALNLSSWCQPTAIDILSYDNSVEKKKRLFSTLQPSLCSQCAANPAYKNQFVSQLQ